MIDPLPFQPLIIIGAGRSGTNILRDTLTTLPGYETWPCDEINPIWRHGNLFWPDDEIPADRATPKVKRFIRGQFSRFWKSSGSPAHVVEKTCANTLRVPFVSAVVPEARYINLVRNGYDVIASAERRWKGDFELPKGQYFMAKARYTPLRDLPIYGARFLRARLKMKTNQSKHLDVWGPRFKGMSHLTDTPLIDLIAMQWAACIEKSDAAFAALPEDHVTHVRYEDFMARPVEILGQLVGETSGISGDQMTKATAKIRAPSSAKKDAVANRLSPEVRERVDRIMAAKGYG